MASTRSCRGLMARPDLYAIHKKEGLIQVILVREKGGGNSCALIVGSAISGE
jgi:hypothetical protein